MGDGTKAAADHLEHEMVLLTRLLEALTRRRNYPLDRAPYLLLLQLAEGAKNINELATTLALDGTTVTRQIASMETRGLVEKTSDPTDGRIALVARTEKGARLVEDMRRVRVERVKELFSEWSEEDMSAFAGYLARCNLDLYDYIETVSK